MTYLFQIASKYLFAIRHRSIVNIITLISIISVLFGTMAMVVVLSVFNGFDDIIKKLYQTVDSDFKIELKEGRFFTPDSSFFKKLNSIDGIESFSEIIEYKMLAYHLEYTPIVIDVKGVGGNYLAVNNIADSIWKGDFFYKKNNHVIVGSGVSHALSLKLLDYESPLKLSFFQDTLNLFGLETINQVTHSVYVSGVFQTHTEIDQSQLLLNIEDLRSMLQLAEKCSSVEIKIDSSSNAKNIEDALNLYFSDKFLVKNRLLQRPFIYKMVKTEKLAVYVIFSFILIISMLSLMASLVVLLMEKQKDIFILNALGLIQKKVKAVFFFIGLLVTSIGILGGVILGGILCFLQDKFNIIKLGADSSFLDAYPVKVNSIDIVMIVFIVSFLGAVASFLVSRYNRFYQY